MQHCHDINKAIAIPAGARKIVLVGNPNVGKSVFFNALTGLYVDVSNFPGTTVEISYGPLGRDVVIDTPGVYGISSFNDEEKVARDVILDADIVLNIVDACHLERDLFLTLQVIDTGKPVVVALNMMDEAKARKRMVDVDLLSDLLGVPVIPTVATRKSGIDQVKAALDSARPGIIDHELAQHLAALQNRVAKQGDALLILEDDPHVAEYHGVEPGGMREEIYRRRRRRVDDIVRHAVKEECAKVSFRERLGQWMMRPFPGIPILMAVLAAAYWLIGVFVAQTVVEITEEVIMSQYYYNFIMRLVTRFIAADSALGAILAGEFGLLTMTPIYLFGLLLPLVVGFYLFLSAIEDSGYLPRVATLTDRALTGIGLNGRAIIPIILGFGCVTMATITTRLLGSRRERVIATALLGITIPCSAQLGVIAGLISPLGPGYIVIYVVTIVAVFGLVGRGLHRVLPGESTHLLIDLPPLRLPRLENVLKKTFHRTWHFLSEAAPLFALGALLITVLQLTGLLDVFQNIMAPVTTGLLRLPRETATAFIMGIMRRDFGAAGLYDINLTPVQTLVALVTITLFVPCIASVMIIFKERTWKESAAIWAGSFVTAFLTGGILAWLMGWLA
ncbi:MAG TPA: ferrous iron transport protein B [Bacillota bacterium]|nr:ferrous iron transport protein B [Bacillota bacterium]